MTKSEFLEVARDACAESDLHASYSLPTRDYHTMQFAHRVILAGIAERLDAQSRAGMSTRKRRAE